MEQVRSISDQRTAAGASAASGAAGVERAEQVPQPLEAVETAYGTVMCAPTDVRLGELFVTDEGVEVEVVGFAPLTFAEAPEEDEDWGE